MQSSIYQRRYGSPMRFDRVGQLVGERTRRRNPPAQLTSLRASQRTTDNRGACNTTFLPEDAAWWIQIGSMILASGPLTT